MWSFRIAGIELYFLLGWFWVYCFLGWIWESCYMSVVERHPVNRGFVNGPFLTIYGFGAVSVYLILKPLDGKWPLLFVCGALLATLLEYITAEILEAVFHTSWWDYTEKKWNFRGKICPESTVCWGVFTLLMFYVLQPGVSWAVRQLDMRMGKVLIILITLIYCVDFGISAAAAFTLDHNIRIMEAFRKEMLETFQRNRLTGAEEEAKQRFSVFRRETGRKVRVYPGKARTIMKNYMDWLRQESGQKLDELIGYGTEKREELVLRREQVKKEILERMEKTGMIWNRKDQPIEKTIRRYVDAYPHLNHVQPLEEEEKAEHFKQPEFCRYVSEKQELFMNDSAVSETYDLLFYADEESGREAASLQK